jgi:2-(1,2-epoxy-1,2-dihydrophenyl)acetyl-CoA isomerase
MAFVRIGLVPDSGAAYLLPRTVGMAEAIRLSITGDRIDAAEALRIRLVSSVVPAERCVSEAQELAARLASLPTRAIGMTKRLFANAAAVSLGEAMELEARYQDAAGRTDDHVEGVLAFSEKREPRFTGR